jgi:asparagine synthase (glutamine-hydrolysing)
MCGIAGIVSTDGRPPDVATAQRLIACLDHRGPDGRGSYADDRVALEHVRLSILDPSPAGAQPMSRHGLYLIHNGEVYNYQELARELSAQGYEFTTGTDTEVMLAAYHAWGLDAVRRFNGMWAFALWDPARSQLLLSRDRMGVKPLYYRRASGTIAFASEVAALQAVGPISADDAWRPEPDLGAVRDFLTRALVDHSDHTFVEGIRSLPPAHNMIVTRDRVALQRYWGPPSLSDDASRGMNGTDQANDERLVDEFAALFSSSVRLRLRADVPLGSCLSGGLDSSAVVATTALLVNEPIEGEPASNEQRPRFGFHARFPADGIDESEYAALVAEAADLKMVYRSPQVDDIMSNVSLLLRAQGEPFAGSSVYAQWSVMQAAHEHGLKVLLDGQGGDEVVGGYPRYLGYRIGSLLASGAVTDALAELHAQVATGIDPATTIQAMARALMPAWADGPLRTLARGRYGVNVSGDLARAPTLVRKHAETGTALAKRLWQDLASESLPALLRYEDRNSMAFGIEARVPFLDYRLIEFTAALPDRLRVDGGSAKVALRRAMRGRVPEAIVRRQDKMGFATPERNWLRRSLPQISGLLRHGQVTQRGWVRQDEIERLLRLDARSNAGQLWRLLTLEIWLGLHWARR